jgi:hypothetical protein
MVAVVGRRGRFNMKMIKLLLCTAISVLITGCPDMTFGASCITLIVENKSNIGFYLEVQGVI